MATDITHFKETLLQEKALLERELASVGRINPDNPDDWEPVAADLNIDRAETEEQATGIEDFEKRSAVESHLEERYREIAAALERIEKGVYGTCERCGMPIEEERLGANPAARTCKAHLNA